MKLLNKISTSIDDDVVVPCPKKEFKPAMAAEDCPKCEHFDGVGVMSTAQSLEWAKRYCIRCAHPIERRVQHIKFEFKTPGIIAE